MHLQEHFAHHVVGDELSLCKLSEHKLRESVLDSFQVDFIEWLEGAILAEYSVSQHTVQMCIAVKRLPCVLKCQHQRQFRVFNPEALEQTSLSRFKEDIAEFSIITELREESLWD